MRIQGWLDEVRFEMNAHDGSNCCTVVLNIPQISPEQMRALKEAMNPSSAGFAQSYPVDVVIDKSGTVLLTDED